MSLNKRIQTVRATKSASHSDREKLVKIPDTRYNEVLHLRFYSLDKRETSLLSYGRGFGKKVLPGDKKGKS